VDQVFYKLVTKINFWRTIFFSLSGHALYSLLTGVTLRYSVSLMCSGSIQTVNTNGVVKIESYI